MLRPTMAWIFISILIPAYSAPNAVDDLEKLRWQVGNWGNQIQYGLLDVEGRGKVLKANILQQGGKDMAILQIGQRINAKEKPFLVFDMKHNYGWVVPVAMAVNAGPTYFESSLRRFEVDGKYHRFVYDLSQANFKCAKYNWVQGVPIENVENIRNLFLILYPQRRSGLTRKTGNPSGPVNVLYARPSEQCRGKAHPGRCGPARHFEITEFRTEGNG